MEKILNFFRGLGTKIRLMPKRTIMLGGLVIILLVGVIITIIFLSRREDKQEDLIIDWNNNVVVPTSTEENLVEEIDSLDEMYQAVSSTAFDQVLVDYPIKIDNTVGEITVDASAWPIKLSKDEALNLLVSRTNKELLNQLNITSSSLLSYSNDIFKIGKILSGPFVGSDLYLYSNYFLLDGPGAPNLWRIVATPEKLIFLNKDFSMVMFDYTAGSFGEKDDAMYKYFSDQKILNEIKFYRTIFEINNKISIKNDIPDKIKIPNSKFYLNQIPEDWGGYSNLVYQNTPSEIKFEYATGRNVYFDGFCLMVNSGNGVPKTLYISHPLFNYSEDIYTGKPVVLDFTFLDGTKNKVAYSAARMGCSFTSCLNYAGPDLSDLKKVGTTPAGDFVYEYLNETNRIDKARLMYDGTYFSEDTKITFEDFLADYPLLFWQDPFGGVVELKNAKYSPAAECAKPVVYLYPEQEMDVNVKVSPTGGLTITEPAYNNGWVVKAKPNGELYNYADGQNYPYLFWEGFGLNYEQFDQGFVVEKENVEKFLRKILTKQGLINNEIDEFIEFWVPKMTEKPYYFISFMPQQLFDRMAPLVVEPKPDTVIRVFMGYRGLDEKITVREPRIITPARRGFTVVEWGGALNKD